MAMVQLYPHYDLPTVTLAIDLAERMTRDHSALLTDAHLSEAQIPTCILCSAKRNSSSSSLSGEVTSAFG